MPEIDIWRAASLMLERYGEKALEKNTACADEPAADGDPNGAAPWHRISDAVGQLANKTPPGSVHPRNFTEAAGRPRFPKYRPQVG
jgi:hypothetical protein